MSVILVGINAKYVHTNLAVRYLYSAISNNHNAQMCEFSINDNPLSIERTIILKKPDVLAFSCYIWNINLVLELCSDLKKALPSVKIILGGPEVSYDAASLMQAHPFVDYIIKGEGEIVFPLLINHILCDSKIPEKGIVYREDEIIDRGFSDSVDFYDIPFPYDASLFDSNKIIYYESSRGCPYSCKYCLSGANARVRFKDVELVKEDLTFFDSCGASLVKFVDRTFNADRRRADEIWKHISSLKGNTRFHMEITGELLDDEAIDVLKHVRGEKLQFEIGVQSTNSDTLSAINRKCDIKRLFKYIHRLLTETQIHVHLDLIAGLPFEDFNSFRNSFNEVLTLRPHVLQLGFLKLLKGSSMLAEAGEHEIVYRNKAPYEIISNKYISCEEILFLKDLEMVFDKVYNSGAFAKTVDYLFAHFHDAFEVFSCLTEFFRLQSLIGASFSKTTLFDYVYECFSYLGKEFEKCLRYDYIHSLHPGKLPYWANSNEQFKFSDEVYSFLKDEAIKQKCMPYYYNIPAKTAIKHLRFEKFEEQVLVFDYKNNTVYDVTQYFYERNGDIYAK
ncbi:MAG: DUF4080 domain-containing protein [Clostridia bacterium]|nr:DUF4080 domain-containing protein [Clostridia bacterium]